MTAGKIHLRRDEAISATSLTENDDIDLETGRHEDSEKWAYLSRYSNLPPNEATCDFARGSHRESPMGHRNFAPAGR